MKYIILLISIITFNANSAIFITPKPPEIGAYSAIVIDHNSGKIIAAKRQHDKRQPASLTKLMTAYVVFQLVKDGRIKITDNVLISENAWKTGGSKSFIEVGKHIPLEVLLKGMIIQSGNDAAVALAEHIAGTEGTFATYMNEYAKILGMENTRFENASGLPIKDQYTTAYDLSLLASALINDFPQFYKLYSQKEFTYNKIRQYNRNKLLWTDNTVDGLKTGYTKKAGYCLVTSANRVGMRLISVVLGAKSTTARTSQTQKMLDYGFRFFETQKIDDLKKSVPIIKSTQDNLKVGLAKNTYLTLPRGQFRLLKRSIKINSALAAPVKKGQVVGEFIHTFEGKILSKLPLVALEDAELAGLFSRMIDSIKSIF